MGFIEVDILNWSKHQPRKDIKHPTWFAINNRILEDSKLFDLSESEWKALLYLFCQASQQNSGTVKISFSHAKRVCDVQKKSIISLLEKAAYAGVTSALRECNAPDTRMLRDTTLQYKTDKTNKHALRVSFDLSWKLFKSKFPGSVKGAEAEGRYLAQVKEPSEVDSAITNYDRFLKLSVNDWRKPKTSFETFLGANSKPFWRDFIEWSDEWATDPGRTKSMPRIQDLLGESEGGA